MQYHYFCQHRQNQILSRIKYHFFDENRELEFHDLPNEKFPGPGKKQLNFFSKFFLHFLIFFQTDFTETIKEAKVSRVPILISQDRLTDEIKFLIYNISLEAFDKDYEICEAEHTIEVIPRCFSLIAKRIITGLSDKTGGQWYASVGLYQLNSVYVGPKMYALYFKIGQIAFFVGRVN